MVNYPSDDKDTFGQSKNFMFHFHCGQAWHYQLQADKSKNKSSKRKLLNRRDAHRYQARTFADPDDVIPWE